MARDQLDLSRFGYVFASDRVAKDGAKVRFMYRESPDSDEDSGWRFFSGDEDQSYVSDPAHIGIYDIQTILEIDASVRPFLGRSAPCAFERYDADSAFHPARRGPRDEPDDE